MVEQLITDFGSAYSLPSVIFRYFNAAGADPSGELGEDHTPETHLIPIIFDAMTGRIPKLEIFGDDYPTADGTCIRDYVHVSDLANAHVQGLEKLLSEGGQHIFNLGNGQGYSVREVISRAEQITGIRTPTRIGVRRSGDPAILVSDAQKARKILKWKPRYEELGVILKHAWKWHKSIHI